MTDQPTWKFVENLGDVNPVEHGGFFVFIDETGVYAPEVEMLDPPCEGQDKWTVYRFILEPCTFKDGILSDNRFHPNHPAWFAKPEKDRKERPQDTTYLNDLTGAFPLDELTRLFCSDDPKERAVAWREVGEYHGYDNLDSDPLRLTEEEVKQRYIKILEG